MKDDTIFTYQEDRKWCREYNGYTIGNDSTKWYQENCRIYLDEYPEVEEWDYLPLFDNTFVMKRFMVKK